MGEVIHLKPKGARSPDEGILSKLQAEGMVADAAVICSKLLSEMSRIGLPPPLIRGGINGGFLLVWDRPEIGVALEAPGQGGRLWSIHRHDKLAVFKPCYEMPFEFNGNIEEIAEAVMEAMKQ